MTDRVDLPIVHGDITGRADVPDVSSDTPPGRDLPATAPAPEVVGRLRGAEVAGRATAAEISAPASSPEFHVSREQDEPPGEPASFRRLYSPANHADALDFEARKALADYVSALSTVLALYGEKALRSDAVVSEIFRTGVAARRHDEAPLSDRGVVNEQDYVQYDYVADDYVGENTNF